MPWYRGPTLLEALESISPARAAAARPLRFAVQLVQRAGGGRRYLGRIASGAVSVGNEVIVLPSGRQTRVTAVGTPGGARAAAQAGDSVALALADELDVSRGHVIAEAARAPRPTRALEATLVWLAEEPLVPLSRYLLKHTTRTVPVRVAAVDCAIDVNSLTPRPAPSGLALNGIGHVSLALGQAVFADTYAENRATGAFVLIDAANHRTVGAGMIR